MKCSHLQSDVYIMKDQFMGVTTGGIVWSDAVGLVTQCGDNSNFQPGDRILINPGRGWEKDAEGPESAFSMLGLNPCTGRFHRLDTFDNHSMATLQVSLLKRFWSKQTRFLNVQIIYQIKKLLPYLWQD